MFLRGWNPWRRVKTGARDNDRLGRDKFHPRLEGLETRIAPALASFTKNTVPVNLGSVVAGTNITYTLQIQQDATSDFSVLINDATPLNTTFVSAAPDPTNPTKFTTGTPAVGGTGQIQFRDTGSLPANEVDNFQIVLHVNSNAPSGPLTNTAQYTSAATPSPGVPSTPATVNVTTSTNVSVTKTESTSAVTAGTDISYTISVSNTGPSDAQNISLTDAVPANATFTSETQTAGPAFTVTNPPAGGTGTTTATITTLPSGASATFVIVDHVVPSAPNGSTITNTARVSTTSPNTSGQTTSTVNATVQQPVFTGAAGVPVNGFEFSPLNNVPVATFNFGGGHPASDFTAIINWGDNNTSIGTVTKTNSTYTVSGSHNYTDERNYQISVAVTQGTTSTTINSTAAMLEELLPGGTRGTADQRFLSEVYRDMLGRAIDPTGLASGSAELAAGVSRLQVVLNIQNSTTDEFRTDEVQAVYQQYLNRPADALGLQNSVNFLKAGGTVEQLIAIVASSTEFNLHTQGTNDSWLDLFYQDALHRTVDPAGRAAWDAQFAAGKTRAQIAATILASDEYFNDLIQADYLRYLDRTPDAFGASNALAAFKSGFTDELVIALVMTDSAEFYNKTVP